MCSVHHLDCRQHHIPKKRNGYGYWDGDKAKYLPEMKKLMDKRLVVGLHVGRSVEGTLRGYDRFMNIVLDEAVEICGDGEKRPLGTSMLRGNSIVTMEVYPGAQAEARGGRSR